MASIEFLFNQKLNKIFRLPNLNLKVLHFYYFKSSKMYTIRQEMIDGSIYNRSLSQKVCFIWNSIVNGFRIFQFSLPWRSSPTITLHTSRVKVCSANSEEFRTINVLVLFYFYLIFYKLFTNIVFT